MDASQVYNQWKNRLVFDSTGEKLGTIEDVYLDRGSQQPEWGLVSMGLFGTRHVLVPLGDARVEGNRVHVPYDAERVRTAPPLDPQGELTEEQEQSLYRHYSASAPNFGGTPNYDPPPQPARVQPPARPAPPRAMPQPGDQAPVELREEKIEVRKQPEQIGEVHLRKEVVTERRELDVPVLREVLVLERRPVRRRPSQSVELGQAPEVVIGLNRERVELVKEPLVAEEVAISKRPVEETEHVATDVRREVPISEHVESTVP